MIAGADMTDALLAFSDAVATRVRHAAPLVVGLDWGTRERVSALLWQDGVAVTSEQSLPELEACTAVLPGGARVRAVPAGRDATTNIAVLRLEASAPQVAPCGELSVGATVLALGADGEGGPRARLGIVETLGPAWQSQCGGRIDRLIRLDIALSLAAEGGPVLDAQGGLIGMSTFGPRQSVLVIPTETIARAAGQLLAHGHVRRGWLGVGVQPVQLPRDIEPDSCSGLMVLSIAEGAPCAGLLLPGDILLAAGSVRLAAPRALLSLLGPEMIGQELVLRVLRGGGIVEVTVHIMARPA
jgi:S1-C subfamily serine protease